ncbi:hypothetical protein D046_4703C, partial [Vibrio parahaemolyticus V-223/04]
ASSISQLMEFEDPLGDVEEVTPSEDQSVETLPSEAQAVEGQPKTVVQAVEETVPAVQVQQPVVIPQVQDQYDLIYEWNSTSQS